MAGTIRFSEIIKFYPNNQRIFDNIKKGCNKLVPFVGAGMSVPYYPLWPNALKQLADQLSDRSKKRAVKKMIAEKPQGLLQAAQY